MQEIHNQADGLRKSSAINKAALSIDEFCAAVGLGRTKVYAEIAAGRIKSFKVGKRTLFAVSEPQAFVERMGG